MNRLPLDLLYTILEATLAISPKTFVRLIRANKRFYSIFLRVENKLRFLHLLTNHPLICPTLITTRTYLAIREIAPQLSKEEESHMEWGLDEQWSGRPDHYYDYLPHPLLQDILRPLHMTSLLAPRGLARDMEYYEALLRTHKLLRRIAQRLQPDCEEKYCIKMRCLSLVEKRVLDGSLLPKNVSFPVHDPNSCCASRPEGDSRKASRKFFWQLRDNIRKNNIYNRNCATHYYLMRMDCRSLKVCNELVGRMALQVGKRAGIRFRLHQDYYGCMSVIPDTVGFISCNSSLEEMAKLWQWEGESDQEVVGLLCKYGAVILERKSSAIVREMKKLFGRNS